MAMASTRHGVAAKELERQIGCNYKTAWRMAHELRKHMAQSDSHDLLSGHVEIDESYIGGRPKGKRGRGAEGKTVVFGMLEREGNVRAGPVSDAKRRTVGPLISRNVTLGSTISTNELKAYDHLSSEYNHGRVTHSKEEWVNGIHHVNSLEWYW